jgi:hypothetical protein
MKHTLFYLGIVMMTLLSIFALIGCEDNDSSGPDPTATPAGPTPTPSPTPMGTGPWISGRAVINVLGSTIPPDDEHDKGVMFGLRGPECEASWTRIRARYDMGGEAFYQSKMVGDTNYDDECWGETNYYETQRTADGDWIVTWGVEGGDTWVRYEAPNGTSETVWVGYRLAFDQVMIDASCARPPIWADLSISVISFTPNEVGTSEGC